MIEHDGPDPAMIGIATEALRVGHVLRYDVDSLHYASEVKNVRLNKWWTTVWLQIIEQARLRGKHPLLVIYPSNVGKVPEMHIMTADRHAQLLAYEKKVEEMYR